MIKEREMITQVGQLNAITKKRREKGQAASGSRNGKRELYT